LCKKEKIMKRFATAFTLTASLFVMGAFTGAPAAGIQLSSGEVKELSATASTPADHLKLAAYFNAEAAKFEAEAVEHETLANSYRGKGDSVGAKGPMTGRTAGHCDYFAKVAREKAKANRELATQHELMAKDAEK
jgi:hypothetical protein